MKGVKTNRLLIVVAVSAALGLCSEGAHAGTLRIIHSIDFADQSWWGYDLAWDGQLLWASISTPPSTGGGPTVYQATFGLDPSDGSVVSAFLLPIDFRYGLTWDGNSFWTTVLGVDFPDTAGDDILQVSPDGTILTSFAAPYSPNAAPGGAAWDGTYLWISDFQRQEILQVDPANGALIASFPSPGPRPFGLTWDGSSLWVVDGEEDLVYRIDTLGNVLGSWSTPASDSGGPRLDGQDLWGPGPWGITFDGQYLWILDNDAGKIFQVVIPEPSSLGLLGIGAGSLLVLAWRRRHRAGSSMRTRCSVSDP